MFYLLNNKNIVVDVVSAAGKNIVESETVLGEGLFQYNHYNKTFYELKWRVRFNENGEQIGAALTLNGLDHIADQFIDAPYGFDPYSKAYNSMCKLDNGVPVLFTAQEYEDYTTESKNRAKPIILGMVNAQVAGKDIQDINYKTELKSENNLHAIQFFGKSGFLEKTEMYKDYIDQNNKGQLVIEINEVYATDPAFDSLNPSEREVVSRVKTRIWKKNDNSNVEKTKVTSKKYDTRKKKKAEGIRRRNNIVDAMTDNLGTAGVVSGTFADPIIARTELLAFKRLHNNSLPDYYETANGDIYTEVANDVTTAWLDNVVPDNATTQALVPQMVGKSFRTYIIDKLKGNVK